MRVDYTPKFPSYKERYNDLVNCLEQVRNQSQEIEDLCQTLNVEKNLTLNEEHLQQSKQEVPMGKVQFEKKDAQELNYNQKDKSSEVGEDVDENNLEYWKGSPLYNLFEQLSDETFYIHNPLLRSNAYVSSEREFNLFKDERDKLNKILLDKSISNYEKERALAAYRQSIFSWSRT